MLSISKILVPVDFSGRCLNMLPCVKGIASRYGAQVTLLHVMNPFITVPPTGFSGPAMIPIPQSELKERSKQLDEFAVAELRGIEVQRLVYEGEPASQIVSFAQTEGIDLVAMPTHGYGTLRRFLIGSVTAKVLHDVSCPVLTDVHTDKRSARRAVNFANVLCAIDLAGQSRDTLLWAAALATDMKATLGIAHAITPPNPGVVVLLSPDFDLKLEEIARRDLEKLQSAAGVEAATLYTAAGDTAKTVCALAESGHADLLIIGRGTPEGDSGRLGANAYAIIRQSPCPVISV